MKKILLLCLVCVSCASVKKVPVAETKPTSKVIQIDVDPRLYEKVSTAYLIPMANDMFRAGQYQVALDMFLEIQSRGNLNTVGKVLVYWSIGSCYFMLRNYELARVYYYDFVVAVQIFKELPVEDQLTVDGRNFNEVFDIDEKLERANKMLEEEWQYMKDTNKNAQE